MRTKTLLLTAALSAAGIATSMAQQVYSVNAVGYVNTSLVAGFNLISNPLDNKSGNSIANLFGTQLPDGSIVYKFNNGTYAGGTFIYDELAGGWPAAASTTTVSPGEGVFVRLPANATATVTFVGEVMQGSLSNPIPQGFSIRSSQVPQEGTLVGDLKWPASAGDTIYQFNSGTQRYATSLFDDLLNAWQPSEPRIKVGEAFFARTVAAKNWTRTFSVNQ